MRRDRGSATVLGAAVLAVAVVVGVLLAVVAGAVADRARARAAADLAALAAAHAVRAGLGGEVHQPPEAQPCAVARRTAIANGAHLAACTQFRDGSVQVSAASGRATASARAGPEMEGPGGGSG